MDFGKGRNHSANQLQQREELQCYQFQPSAKSPSSSELSEMVLHSSTISLWQQRQDFTHSWQLVIGCGLLLGKGYDLISNRSFQLRKILSHWSSTLSAADGMSTLCMMEGCGHRICCAQSGL